MEFDTHFQIKKNKTENDFLGNFKVIFWGTKCLKNHPKCLIWCTYSILAFSTIFVKLKLTCLVTIASDLSKTRQMDYFWHF